jgi:hypothetical protein
VRGGAEETMSLSAAGVGGWVGLDRDGFTVGRCF